MTQLSMKGYGTLVHVDDSGHQLSLGTFNSITDVGIQRILNADTSLGNRSSIFHSIILTRNLPRDKFIFTEAELEQYNAYILPLDGQPTSNSSNDKKSFQYTFYTANLANKNQTTDTQGDTLSLAYTDGVGNHYICSYASYSDADNQPAVVTIPAGGYVSSRYMLNFTIAQQINGAAVSFVNAQVAQYKTELGGEYISTNNPTAQPKPLYASTTRLPSEPGTNKLRFRIIKNTGATWGCYMVTALFTLTYDVSGAGTALNNIVEIDLIRPEEASAKLGVDVAAPTGVSQITRLQAVGNGDFYACEFKGDPLSEVVFKVSDRIVGLVKTDHVGFGYLMLSANYEDPFTYEYRSLNDGLLFSIITKNSLGTFEQQMVLRDVQANRISHWNWIDPTHLNLVGRLNDEVTILVKNGYTATGQVLNDIELGKITLTTPDTRYGYDAAKGVITLDILAQYPLFYSTGIYARVKDTAGNSEPQYDTAISINDLGLPNLFEVSRPQGKYPNTLEIGDSIYRVPVITKGSKS